MASITVNIGNTDLSRVVDGICGFFNYQPIIQPIVGDPFPNPETKNQFARRMLVENLKSWVKTFEASAAAETARQAAQQAADLLDIS